MKIPTCLTSTAIVGATCISICHSRKQNVVVKRDNTKKHTADQEKEKYKVYMSPTQQHLFYTIMNNAQNVR